VLNVIEMLNAESVLPDANFYIVKIDIEYLRRYKSPCIYQVSSELFHTTGCNITLLDIAAKLMTSF
jgi:hypothetical protein